MRISTNIVQETRNAVSKDFILMFRLSMIDLITDGSSLDEITDLAMTLEDARVNIIGTDVRWHESRVPTISTSVHRSAFTFPNRRLKLSGSVPVPLCATNRINYPVVAERVLERRYTDLTSMDRPFLADPDIMRKSS